MAKRTRGMRLAQLKRPRWRWVMDARPKVTLSDSDDDDETEEERCDPVALLASRGVLAHAYVCVSL